MISRRTNLAPATRIAPRQVEMTYWHKAALKMFRSGANTIGIATALHTTEADAYNLVAQAREADRQCQA